jgi:cyclopropane fatty-acyl-phospholipid synthase-like methyltransferase
MNPNSKINADEAYYSRERSWPSLFSIQPNSRILDIGCGQGYLGKFLKNTFKCHVTGLDIVEANALSAGKHLDTIIIGNVETMDLSILGAPFDYIIFSDSLEHLLNPEHVLLRISPLLSKENGQLLLSIPNVRNFRVVLPLILSDDWRYTNEGPLDKTHLRFFTLKSITRLLEESFFTVNEVHYNLPLSSKSGVLNLITAGIFRRHLTSHYFIQACPKK